MYAFAPSLKRSAQSRRPGQRRSISAALLGIAGLIAGGTWAGEQIGDLVSWLYDQEAYWEQQLFEAEEAVRVAKEKLDAIAQAKQQAEAEAQTPADSASGGWW